MIIGQRLRDIREMKNLSHDDIEKARGLSVLTFPASRTVTQFLALGTLQKWAKALGMQLVSREIPEDT